MRPVLACVGRGLEITAAATVLLLILTLHGAIIRNAFTLVGIRSESPLLFMVKDDCGTETLIPAALRDSTTGERKPIVVCKDQAAFQVTAKSGIDVMLFVNGRIAQRKKSQGFRNLTFTEVKLRKGLNEIWVSGTERKGLPLWFPFSFRSLPFSTSSERFVSTISTPFGPVSELPVSASVIVEVPQAASSPPRIVRTWSDPDGGSWSLYQGTPGERTIANSESPTAANAFSLEFLLDGFAVRQTPEQKATAHADVPLRRTLEVSKQEDGMVQVSAGACLPEDHLLVRWSRAAVMDGPELVARLYGTQVSNRMDPDNPLWQEKRPVQLGGVHDGCLALSATYKVPGGYVWYRSSGSFPELPGDELVFAGFDSSLDIEGRPADEAEGDRLVWRGSTTPGRSKLYSLRSFFGDTRQKSVDPEGAVQKNDIFATWRDLVTLLPKLVRAILWGLATVAPVGLMLYALDRYRSDDPLDSQMIKTRAGVMALFVLLIALALHPMLLEFVRGFLRYCHVHRLLWDRLAQGRATDLYASIAFVAVFMVVPLFQGTLASAPHSRLPLLRLVTAILSLALLVGAFFILWAQHLIFSPEMGQDGAGKDSVLNLLFMEGCDLPILDIPSRACGLGALVSGWCAVGLATLWLAVYWLYRAVVSRGTVVKHALLASILVFFLPVVIFSLGTVSVVSMNQEISSVFTAIAFIGRCTPFLIVTLLVTLFLRIFGHIVAVMFASPREEKLRSWLRPWSLFALAAVIVWPLAINLGGSPQSIDDSALRFMTLFQSYGGVLALFAPFGIMELLERKNDSPGNKKRFDLPPAIWLLLAAAFAGYLTLWQREPMSVVVLMGTGWVVFKYGLLDPAATSCPLPDATLGRRLLEFLATTQLVAARQKSFEKQFTDGGLSHQALVNERAHLQNLRKDAEQELGLPVSEAKRQLLENGPESSPLRNAYLGAFAGLITAAVFQLLLPLDLTADATGTKVGWLALLREVVVDPNYKIIVDAVGELRLLAFVNAVLNAVALWVVAGFLFGYAFHRIRGDDGFVKAVVFGLGLSVPYLLSQALHAEGAGVSPAGMKHLVPLLFFLLVLGAVVFDGTTLRRQGIGLTKLTEIYGMKTSIGYVSFAGLLASVQPILQLLDWLAG